MRGEVRGVKGEAIGAPFHDVCDDAGREPPRPDALRSFIPHAAKQLRGNRPNHVDDQARSVQGTV
jgi:hypothetical protein